MSTAYRRSTPPGAPARKRRPVLIASAAVASFICAILVGIAVWPHSHESRATREPAVFTPLPVGSKAPAIGLANAGAGDASVRLPVAGALTLVSFLATQPDTASTPSRSQAVELVSLLSQFATKGLHTVIVDDTATPAEQSALENTVYDWQLGSLPLLADPEHDAANRYGITTAPTTLLIDRTGTVVGRWNGYVLTAAVAQAITSALSQKSVS